MMVYDTLRGLDYLLTRPEVDTARVGTLGMSMGSTMAWWVAALDPRLKVCVDICCLTDYQALIEAHNLKGHGVYYFVPGAVEALHHRRRSTSSSPPRPPRPTAISTTSRPRPDWTASTANSRPRTPKPGTRRIGSYCATPSATRKRLTCAARWRPGCAQS